jgi:hypothetical protein
MTTENLAAVFTATSGASTSGDPGDTRSALHRRPGRQQCRHRGRSPVLPIDTSPIAAKTALKRQDDQ